MASHSMRKSRFDRELKVWRQLPRPPGSRLAAGRAGAVSRWGEDVAVVVLAWEVAVGLAEAAGTSGGFVGPELLCVMGPPREFAWFVPGWLQYN